MRTKFKTLNISYLFFVLIITTCWPINANADVIEDQTEVNGVRYRTEYNMPLIYIRDPCYHYENRGDCKYEYNMLPHERHQAIVTIRRRCGIERITKYNDPDWNNKYYSYVDESGYLFYDGSKLPIFDYGAILIKNNASRYEGRRLYGGEVDTMSRRYPYYTGDVWIQDSVEMQALPSLRKKKYHIIFDMLPSSDKEDSDKEEVKLFDDKLLSIRTPRYALVRTGLFKDCTGLHTARIGSAQCVETLAFENCIKLNTVFFETAPYVENNAFKNCPNIKYVVMDGKHPKIPEGFEQYYEENFTPFDQEVYENAILYVHEDQMEDFKRDPIWNKFKNIRDIEEFLSGVETINPDSEVRYNIFNMSGLLVKSAITGENWREGLPSGIYIVKSSLGTVKKEYIK